MPVYPFRGSEPRLADGVFLAPGARVIGDVALGRGASVWFNAVVRGDVNSIRVGASSNIQDGSVLHVTHERHALEVGEGVVVGHGAVLHGCRIDDGALIGIGARVLDGAVVEKGAHLAAGAVVAPGKRIPAEWLAMGVPAVPTRRITTDERAQVVAIVERYVALSKTYADALGWGHAATEEGAA